MKREDVKEGQKVLFYFSGSKRPDDISSHGKARVVHGVVYKVHRVNIEVVESLSNGFDTFYRKPSELTLVSGK